MDTRLTLTRRNFLQAAGLAGLSCAAVTGLTTGMLPKTAQADEMDALIAGEMGSGAIKMEKVTLDAPATAENGTLVRIPITVDHPMEKDNYIQKMAIFVDQNPKPLTAVFEYTPEAGAVQVEIRIKMAKPSKVRVVAKNNKGELFGAIKEVQVAEGGCAG